MSSAYQATHQIPAPGLLAWSEPDGREEPVTTLGEGLDVMVVEQRGAWTLVRCSNDWQGWLDGRQLIEFRSPAETDAAASGLEAQVQTLWFRPPPNLLASVHRQLAPSEGVEALYTIRAEGAPSPVGLLATTTTRVISISIATEATPRSVPLEHLQGVACTANGALGLLALLVGDEPYEPASGDVRDAERFAQRTNELIDRRSSPLAAGLPARSTWVRFPDAMLLVVPTQTHASNTPASIGVVASGIQIFLHSRPSSVALIPWRDITGLAVDGVDQVQTRPSVGAVLAFGVLGLAARRKERLSYLVVSLMDGDYVFEINGRLPTEVRGELSSFLRVPTNAPSESAIPLVAPDPIEQIRRLGELRAAGAITNEEFETTKAALLRQLAGGESETGAG